MTDKKVTQEKAIMGINCSVLSNFQSQGTYLFSGGVKAEFGRSKLSFELSGLSDFLIYKVHAKGYS